MGTKYLRWQEESSFHRRIVLSPKVVDHIRS